MHRPTPALQANSSVATRSAALVQVRAQIAACRRCPQMVGRPVPGPPILSRVLVLGQAPGPREEALGRPFAWTAGRTLFQWLHLATGHTEERVRASVYFAAVARCFPGKAPGGGDRKPSREEADACAQHLEAECAVLGPTLLLPVGTLAIARAFGQPYKLSEVVGRKHRIRLFEREVDAIPLPHPSGLSSWPRVAPGAELLRDALRLISEHPSIKEAFA